MYFKYIDNDCQGKPYVRNYYDTTIISIQKKEILISAEAPLAALVKQVWHLVAQTPLVRGMPPKTPRTKCVSP